MNDIIITKQLQSKKDLGETTKPNLTKNLVQLFCVQANHFSIWDVFDDC